MAGRRAGATLVAAGGGDRGAAPGGGGRGCGGKNSGATPLLPPRGPISAFEGTVLRPGAEGAARPLPGGRAPRSCRRKPRQKVRTISSLLLWTQEICLYFEEDSD